LVTSIGARLTSMFTSLDRDELYSASEILAAIGSSATESGGGEKPTEDGTLAVGLAVQQLHASIDSMYHTATDLSNTAEFERRPAPWLARSKELRARKVIPADTEEQLRKLKNQVQDQMVALSSKERQLDEASIKVELLESRTKDSRQYTATIQRLEFELDALQKDKDRAEAELEDMKKAHAVVLERYEKERSELSNLKKASLADGQGRLLGASGPRDDATLLELTAEANYLKSEISNLQAAIRYLKSENHRLKISPVLSTAISDARSWLDISRLRPKRAHETARGIAAESVDVLDRLLELTTNTKPVPLKRGDSQSTGPSSWRPFKDTPRRQASKQREEFEEWAEWKGDVLRRAKLETRKRPERATRASRTTRTRAVKPLQDFEEAEAVHGVAIVGSAP